MTQTDTILSMTQTDTILSMTQTDIILTPVLTDDNNEDKIKLCQRIANLLQDDEYHQLILDLNNKEQLSKIRRYDKMKLKVGHCLAIDLDDIVQMIKESKIEPWNQNIINSGLTKENIINMLSTRYEDLISPDGKNYRCEDMQRIMSLYPCGIRFTDLGGFFEKISNENLGQNPDPVLGPDLDFIKNIFKEVIPSQASSEMISIFIPGYGNTKNEDIYLSMEVLEKCIIIRTLFENTNLSDELTQFMILEGLFENDWLTVMIPIDGTPFTKTIIHWFRKQDIGSGGEIAKVGNTGILKYYLNVLNLLKDISMIDSHMDNNLKSIVSLSSFESKIPEDLWFLRQAEGKHIPTGDSDIENESNKIDHYIYHNHIVDNVYRLDAGVTNYGKFIRFNLYFNDQIDIDSDTLTYLISENIKTHHSLIRSFGETVHDNDITRSLIDFLAREPVGHLHKYIIDVLDKLWD